MSLVNSKMKKVTLLLVNILTIVFCFANEVAAQTKIVNLRNIDFSKVKIKDAFWQNRMDAVAKNTLYACIKFTELKTGRIRNFEKAAQGTGEHEGIFFDDSDVYKALEAMAYSLRNSPDSVIEATADRWINKIAAAQQKDGYINTYFTLVKTEPRWTDMNKHEAYCAGHLIEAGIAYYKTTGKRMLLDVAIKMANHMDGYFRLANRHWVTGHEEIELALMKLYQLTDNKNYLNLADYFIQQRGKGYGVGNTWKNNSHPEYCQDNLPIELQREIAGHAVRAMYLYTGVADVAAKKNNLSYLNSMQSIWEDVVYRNLYITGGIGAQGINEGFGQDYVLPNLTAYSETCASVGMVLWNQRMNALTGNAKYFDVLERTLYNAALCGLSLTGDHFFYGNPLASEGKNSRKEWFGTACCPSNIARLVASIGGYIYAQKADDLYVNLFIGNQTVVQTVKGTFNINLKTGYPWNGKVNISVNPTAASTFLNLKIRIPGWLNQPVPGNLYQYVNTKPENKALVTLNDKAVSYKIHNGYMVISRKWKKNDKIELNFPFEVEELKSNDLVKEDTGKIALQYGPIIYCIEGKDNNQNTNVMVPVKNQYQVQYEPQVLNGINVINFTAYKTSSDSAGTKTTVKAIPYFSWNNRGANEMKVWMPVFK